MSKTLPAAITVGKAGDSEKTFLVTIEGNTFPLPGIAINHYWATRALTITGWKGGGNADFIDGVIAENGFEAIRQSVDVDLGGNVASIAGTKIKIANPQFYLYDTRFDKSVLTEVTNFENREAEIWLCFYNGSDTIPFSDILLLYRGVVTDVKFDYQYFEFTLESAAIKRHKTIPTEVISKVDYPYAIENGLGKPIPLLFGQLTGGSREFGAYDAIPLIKINRAYEKYILSGNHMAEAGGVSLFIWHDDVGALERITRNDLEDWEITYGRPTTIQLRKTPYAEYTGDIMGTAVELGNASGLEEGTDPNPAFDDQIAPSTYYTMVGSRQLFIRIGMPTQIGSILNESPDHLIFKVHFGTITGSGGFLRYWNPEYLGGSGGFSDGQFFDSSDSNSIVTYDFGADKTAHGRDPFGNDRDNTWTAEEIATYQWGVGGIAGGSIQIYNMWIEINGLLLRYVKPLFPSYTPYPADSMLLKASTKRMESFDVIGKSEAICGGSGLQGVRYGAWIDELGRDNPYDEDDMIDLGCWHIEAILRDELSLTSNDIDVDSFDNVGKSGGVRYLWSFGRIISSQRNSLEYIREFCRTAGLIYFTNYEHKEKIIPIVEGTSVKTIDRTTILENTIKISWSPLDSVYNEFEIKYAHNFLKDSWDRMYYLNASDTNGDTARAGDPNTYTGLCEASQGRYNLIRKFTFNAEWFPRQAATTVPKQLMKWFAEWLCYRKLIVEFTSALDHIDLELGDQVKFDHTLIPAALNNSANFMVFDISHDKDRIGFKCIQIPGLLP